MLAAQEYYEKHKVNANPATAEDKELLRSVSRDCVTAVTDESVEAALGGSNEDKLFVIVTEQDAGQDVHNPEVTADGLYHPDKIAKKIHSELPGCGCNFIPEFSGNKDNDRVLTEATGYKEVIFITFCATAPYRGQG